MAILVPNTACTYTACGLIPSACNRWISLGFTATPGGSGSAAFYSGSALTNGSPLLLIVCASGMQTYQSPLFNSPVSILAASISGGSAIVWTKARA